MGNVSFFSVHLELDPLHHFSAGSLCGFFSVGLFFLPLFFIFRECTFSSYNDTICCFFRLEYSRRVITYFHHGVIPGLQFKFCPVFPVFSYLDHEYPYRDLVMKLSRDTFLGGNCLGGQGMAARSN